MKKNTRYYLDLITVLTQKDLKVRYKNNVLGYFWSVANPLAYSIVFFLAFKVVMKIQMEDYALFLIAGLFPWQWISNSMVITPLCFLVNASIIKKVNFPRNIIPLTLVLQDLIHFVCAIPVIVLFLFLYHKTPSWSWLVGIPVLLVIQFIMVYGISLVLSSANLFFRDLERLAGIFTTLLFYFTPIIYNETMIPPAYKWVITLNPFAPLIISWRDMFLEGRLHGGMIAISFVYSLVSLAIGTLVYRKLTYKFAEVI